MFQIIAILKVIFQLKSKPNPKTTLHQKRPGFGPYKDYLY